jgi:hypothetical protein
MKNVTGKRTYEKPILEICGSMIEHTLKNKKDKKPKNGWGCGSGGTGTGPD